MTLQQYNQLRAESNALERLLQQMPESNTIDRIGLEYRRNEIAVQLAAQAHPPRDPVHATLTFRGRPIVGESGVSAEFGAASIKAFADAVAAIGASQGASLGSRGVIPNREDYRLLITGTAVASFGFELQEAPRDGEMRFPELSLVEPAIERTQQIMAAAAGSDDELADAVSDAGTRAIESMRAFLRVLADNDATCTLSFRDRAFRFKDVAQVRQSFERLDPHNIQEEDVQIEGMFRGVLPGRRIFEFTISDTDEEIFGRIGPEISEPEDINQFLRRKATISVHTTRIGNGRPRYVLSALPDLPPDVEERPAPPEG